jgi:hypothetical protein
MTTPHEVKLGLERKALEMQVTIVGVHSIRMEDDTTCSAIFDIEPDESHNGLFFLFELPELVSKRDLSLFALWLASPDYGSMTVH